MRCSNRRCIACGSGRFGPPRRLARTLIGCCDEPGDLWLASSNGCHLQQLSQSRELLEVDGLLPCHMIFTDPPFNVRIDGHAVDSEPYVTGNFKSRLSQMSSKATHRFLAQVFNGAHFFHSIDGLPSCITQYSWTGGTYRSYWRLAQQVYSELEFVCVWVKDDGASARSQRPARTHDFFQSADGKVT